MPSRTRSILSICALAAIGLALAYFSGIQSKNAATNTNNYNFANVVSGLDGTGASVVSRIANPYPTAPESPEAVGAHARSALVNIFCQTSGGPIKPISGSGVIIDPRGVILTNAHIAQYVLLSEESSSKLNCTIRTGSPARATWRGAVLYIREVWVDGHAKEISAINPVSTGEHDYALLSITGTIAGAPPSPSDLPFLSVDTLEGAGFAGDHVFIGSYPAEFVMLSAIENGLLPALSQSSISQLLSFGTKTIDLFSFAGVREAQSGSSGGAVVNSEGKLIGLLVTTSDAATAENRTLHALTLNYIDRDLKAQTGKNLSTFLAGDVSATSLRPLLQQYQFLF